MTTRTLNLDEYLKRIHRRWSFIRAAERVGLSVLVACLISLVLSTILLARGEPAIGLIGACLIVGLVAGVIIGLLTRPRLFDAAAEVDRQLALSDLLATALSIRESKTMVADAMDEQWSATILAMAEARCATIAREPLMLRRLGVRAWGGIGLCMAIVLTLGALSTNPLMLRAGNVAAIPGEKALDRSPTSSAELVSPQGMHDPRRESEPESSQHSQIDATSEHSTPAQSDGDNAKHSSSTLDHTGVGAGRTDVTSETPAELRGNTDESASRAGELASGGGRASQSGPRGDASSGTASDASHITAPPWASPTWPAAQQRAAEELNRGDVPDSYRDLVRDYFSR